jgi:fucose 4-O-acetylase-like acetyltransferase
MESRNESIDFFRLIAAIAIVVLHTGFGLYPPIWQDYVKLFTRFAVPFFFILSGHFFQVNWSSKGELYFLSTLRKLLNLYILAIIVYFIPVICKYFLSGIIPKDLFSFQTLLCGNYYHLWFLGSMIFSYIFIWYFLKRNRVGLLIGISFILLMVILLNDSYNSCLNFQFGSSFFSRFFSSIPFMVYGFVAAKYKRRLNIVLTIFIIFFGFGLEVVEARYLFLRAAYEIGSHQFLIGTYLMSIGVYHLASSITLKCNKISIVGREFSLFIYLYHPFVNFFLFEFLYRLFKLDSPIFFFSPLISLLGICIFINIVKRFFPNLYMGLNGKVNFRIYPT